MKRNQGRPLKSLLEEWVRNRPERRISLKARWRWWKMNIIYEYNLCGYSIKPTDTIKDLGVFSDSKLCFNGVHSASWSDKLSSYLNKEVAVRFRKLKMQLWDSMCWPHVNPVPSGAVGKDFQRRLLSRPRLVRAVAPRKKIVYCNEFA
jgi:hypothetical protein